MKSVGAARLWKKVGQEGASVTITSEPLSRDMVLLAQKRIKEVYPVAHLEVQ